MYCFDTDIMSAVLGRKPPLHLIRRLASLPAERQLTTAITVGELLYGSAKRNSAQLTARVRTVILSAAEVLPFDEAAAQIYGSLRADLESQGRRLAEPDLRIASIVLSRDLTLVTGNVRHFARVPELRVENWLKN
ncbi:MAG TPA: PIN domain-containing protein [Actinomycetota bacterium]|nr:PIN domain-containing protein [Actinomycetota bacterium]